MARPKTEWNLFKLLKHELPKEKLSFESALEEAADFYDRSDRSEEALANAVASPCAKRNILRELIGAEELSYDETRYLIAEHGDLSEAFFIAH